MAPPMRSASLLETGHRARVAESSGGHATAKPTDTISSTIPPAAHQSANFEYDDNEWDVGIGDLIIDLDADIEKTNEVTSMAANAAPGAAQGSKTPSAGKMHIEHSATADKGLKMKIKRTKPGSKTSEAKHEIVKSNEQNGSSSDQTDVRESSISLINKHNPIPNASAVGSTSSSNTSGNNKRGSSGHRRDKVRDKHGSSSSSSSCSSTSSSNSSSGSSFSSSNEKSNAANQKGVAQTVSTPSNAAEVNGIIRLSSSQPGPPRTVFPVSTGPGPPQNSPRTTSEPSPGAPASPPSGPKGGDQLKDMSPGNMAMEEQSPSPPPVKKVKTEIKEVTDVCIGTSVGTITEPDCLGPCEPGTSVTLEGIVWHETEGGVLVVNVTWRGKTYVGTLLDCTRHDWAPPRFCDSPTSDLDSRTPKGRETRSSVHSKLRNGGNIAIKGRRGGTNNGSGQSTTPSSPTPFVLPRPDSSTKRKSRSEEEPAQLNNTPGKKSKVVIPPPVANPLPTNPTPCGSPPPSPVLLECPEPNCSKKYKHINGLKYHQSHAHGSADDDDTKDVTSTSENDESNIEAPSPATPVKSPDKSQDGPATPLKKESSELPILLRGSGNLLEMPSQSVTPRSTPPSPATPQSNQESPSAVRSPNVVAAAATSASVDKNIIKPGILRYTGNEEYSIGVFSGSNIQGLQSAGSLSSGAAPSNAILDGGDQPRKEPDVPCQTPLFTPQFPNQANQPTNAQIQQQPPLSPQRPQSPNASAKVSQFKVKPASALMPEDKKTNSNNNKSQLIIKKKNRKSPAGGPDSPQIEELPFDAENTGRDEVQSPAYSDISDDGAPVVDADMNDKSKNLDKKAESGHTLPPMPQYGMYHPFYGQTHHQYLVSQENNSKEQDVQDEKSAEKEKKDNPEYPQKVLQHYYPYGYVPSYPYNMDTNYGGMSLVQDDKMKDDRKESSSPIEPPAKPPVSMPNPIQIPMPTKMKADHNPKDKQNENHQILKESIEMKNQMNSFLYSRPQNQPPQQPQPPQQQPAQQQPQQPPPSHHGQREEDIRRFYVYSEQKRKEPQSIQEKSTLSSGKSNLPQSPNMKVKEIKMEDKKEKEVKQEGVKPTMETQGPPPPPTSQYAYIHPSYMQQAHYGALPFDPNHPMYRGIMVPGPYGSSPYLHAPIQRYHAPEDLSRAPPPSKALDMLQHHAQYYSSHKIHELQERAIKSPTPKTSVASSSPSTNQPGGPPSSQAPSQVSAPGGQPGGNVQQGGGKQPPNDNKESRSPPPQRHVHTHHHTHVGLGYPMYPAPYGAAVLASQQAAAVTVINPYPTK